MAEFTQKEFDTANVEKTIGILEEAERMYPIGTEYWSINKQGDNKDDLFTRPKNAELRYFDNDKTMIAVGNGFGLIYANGKWAEIKSKNKNAPIVDSYLIW